MDFKIIVKKGNLITLHKILIIILNSESVKKFQIIKAKTIYDRTNIAFSNTLFCYYISLHNNLAKEKYK